MQILKAIQKEALSFTKKGRCKNKSKIQKAKSNIKAATKKLKTLSFPSRITVCTSAPLSCEEKSLSKLKSKTLRFTNQVQNSIEKLTLGRCSKKKSTKDSSELASLLARAEASSQVISNALNALPDENMICE